jgi:Secretion system C-terminal sorting domain
MNKFLITILLVFSSITTWCQLAGDFQTNGAVTFSAATNWQKYDGAAWVAAGSAPTSADGVITIQTGHTATYNLSSAGLSIDQLVIKGTLIYAPTASAGAMTIANGTGDDIQVESGGILRQSTTATSTFPVITVGATIRVKSGGMIEATNSAGNSINWASDVAAATATAMTWETDAVYFWNNNSNFSTSGRVYFPNATSTIPIFRIGGSQALVGSNTAVTFNGIFEVISTASIDWNNGSGNKIFRNGIRNNGAFNCSSATVTGKFIISDNAILGGAGIIQLPLNGLQIASTATVTLENNKTIKPNTASSNLVIDGKLITNNFLINTDVNAAGIQTYTLNGILTSSNVNGLAGSTNTTFVSTNSPILSIASTSTVEYNGSSPITASLTPVSFGNLTINNSAGVTLSASSTVINNLKLSSGKLILGINDISAGSVSDGSSSSYVVTNSSGKFKIQNIQALPITFHVGASTSSYDPVKIDNTAGTADEFSVNVATTLPYPTSSNTNTIAKVWNIAETIPMGSSVILSLTLNNLTTVAGGTFVPGSVVLGHGNGATYDVLPATFSAGTFTSTGAVTTFSPFIIANDIALGVSLKSFTAQLTNKNTVMLNWQTENEKDNSGFEIQRSADAKTWSKIGFVKGKGQSSIAFDYTFEDKGPLSPAGLRDVAALHILTYYRLKQVDFDGKESFSKVENVYSSKKGDKFSVFPNPLNSKTATISMDEDMLEGVLIVTNSIGSIVKKENINSKTMTLDLSNLNNGLYIFEVQKAQNRSFQKVLIVE